MLVAFEGAQQMGKRTVSKQMGGGWYGEGGWNGFAQSEEEPLSQQFEPGLCAQSRTGTDNSVEEPETKAKQPGMGRRKCATISKARSGCVGSHGPRAAIVLQ